MRKELPTVWEALFKGTGEIMPPLRIPEQDQNGLIQIGRLTDDELDQLVSALSQAEPTVQFKELIAKISPHVTTIQATQLTEIVQTLVGMSSARLDFDSSVPEFADFVCRAMEQSNNDDLKRVGEECQGFKRRITRLLGAEPLLYPAKGFNVMYDHDRLFLSAKTLTDIRAVFGSDLTEAPKAAAIIHTLKISYRQDDLEKNFHLAMDSHDIESLMDTLKRALSKAEGLKTLLNKAIVTQLDAE
jgi:hypothetical protein